MQDRPSARELLEAVAHFLERDAIPELDGPRQYHARVAANVMRVLSRELELGPAFHRAEWQRLSALLGDAGEAPADESRLVESITRLTSKLCERIRRGDADAGARRDQVLGHVRQTVEEKLAIAKPEMLK
ncbi:MAG: DUF6285 domain-containing protein [Candidatus Binatia bacterium]